MLIRFVNLLKASVAALAICAVAQSAFAQNRCLISIESYLSTLPAFSAPMLQNVVNSLREQGALHLQWAGEGRLNTGQIQGYEMQMRDFRSSELTALGNHISQGGQLNEATCNPPQGSQAMAWAATRMGIAFNTWAINTIRCNEAQSNFAPMPQFCPYTVQTNAPAPSPASPAPRDDPKVFGRSARGR